MKKILITCFLSPLPLIALPIEPWLGNVWQFEFRPAYTYSHFNKVENAKKPLKHSSNDQFLRFGLGVVPMLGLVSPPDWGVDLEIEFADTPRQNFGFQSAALLLRKQWLDDIVGDPISLTTGISLRGVSHKSLRDISCPYHSYANIEFNAAAGKEWSHAAFWTWRTFAFAALGMANRGYPWGRAVLSFQGNHLNHFQYELFTEGYMGFGPQRVVNINHFFGYAKIKHRSIDVGFNLRYLFDIWGSLNFTYSYRVFARSFPAHANFFTLWYQLPFSLF